MNEYKILKKKILELSRTIDQQSDAVAIYQRILEVALEDFWENADCEEYEFETECDGTREYCKVMMKNKWIKKAALE